MTDLTPTYELTPFKFKVVADDTNVFGQTLGGMIGNATSAQQGYGDEIYKISSLGIQLGDADFSDAPFSVSMAGALVATSATISGSITATTGEIGGFTIGATDLTATAGGNTTILSSGATAFSAGPTGSPTATITQAGVITATGAVIDGTSTIGGRTASTLASAIDASGQLITNTLDTSAKTILAEFSFGASGAIAMKTDANNGLWLSPTGILGKKAGVNTFTITTSGDATFAGTLSAPDGTLGSITAGSLDAVDITGSTITGSTIKTSGSGARIELSSTGDNLTFIDSSDNDVLRINDTGRIVTLTQYENEQALLIHSVASLALTGASNLVNMEVGNASSDDNTLRLSNGGSGSALLLATTGNAKCLEIVPGGLAVFINDHTGGSPTILIDKEGSGDVFNIQMDDDSSNSNVAIKIANNNTGAGEELAFWFAGGEYDTSISSVSNLAGVVKVVTSDGGTQYIPVYNTAS